MRLYELARIVRSKNAGPFTLTLDLVFETATLYQRGLRCLEAQRDTLASLYGARPDQVFLHPFAEILTVKVTLPRTVASGGSGDRDVYGSQQHFPLADLQEESQA